MKKIIDKLKQFLEGFCEIFIIKFSMHLKIKRIISFEVGWFYGQDFRICEFKIFERIDNNYIVFISLQILKFCISLYYDGEK